MALLLFTPVVEVVRKNVHSVRMKIKKYWDKASDAFSKLRNMRDNEEHRDTEPIAADAEMQSLNSREYHPAVQHNEEREDPREMFNRYASTATGNYAKVATVDVTTELSPAAVQQHDEEEDRKLLPWDRSLLRMGFAENTPEEIRDLMAFLILPWIGQWLFWAGFLRLAGDTFCPPKLWTNTTVWTVCSALGAFFGAAF